MHSRSRCVDAKDCLHRRIIASERARRRNVVIVLEEPTWPDAPLGSCRWCGDALTGVNASRRNYCYRDREGKDCLGAWNDSRVYSARDAIMWRGDADCAECGSTTWDWEADHIDPIVPVDPSRPGGLNVLENLQRLCRPCHHAKTARENAARQLMVAQEGQRKQLEEAFGNGRGGVAAVPGGV